MQWRSLKTPITAELIGKGTDSIKKLPLREFFLFAYETF